MPVTSLTRSSKACGAFSTKRYRFSSSSAIRAMRRQGCRSTRSVTRWSVWWTTRTAHPGRLSRCCDRATGKARGNCGRRPWWSADARSEIGWPATTTKSSGCRGTRPPTRSSRRSARWPASTTRMSTRIQRPKTGSKRSMRPITCCRIPKPASATTDSAKTSGRFPRTGKSGWALPVAGGFGGAGRSGARVRYGQGFGGAGGGINIEDLFGDMFGGGGGFGPIPGADQEAVLELTVEEAYRGGKRRDLTGWPQLRGQHSRRCHRRSANTAGGRGRPG